MPGESPQIRVAVLGQVCVDGPSGSLTSVSGAAANAVAALAMAPGHFLSTAGLADDVWPERLPERPKAALQTVISRLRSGCAPGLLRSTPGGYGFDLEGGVIDIRRAADLTAQARASLSAGDAATATQLCDEANELWRGEPAAGVGNRSLADEIGRAATSLQREITLVRIEALVASGRADDAVRLAETLAGDEPLNDQAALLLLRSLAGAGRVGDALAAYAEFRERLVEALGADPAAEVARFHESLLRQEDPLAVPRGPRRVGVRPRADTLIGREGDLDAVETLISRAQVVTVTGLGGVGKSRVAQDVAARLARGPSGVVVVSLTGVRSLADVTRALVQAVDLPASQVTATVGANAADRVPPGTADAVVAALAEDEALLVLDDAEQVLDGAAAWVEAITRRTAQVRVLATSRVALRVDGEHEYRLGPLSAGTDTATDADSGPAVELFLARARARRPGLTIDTAIAARLCARLDGVPLAIELAAARCGSLSLAEIEAGLDEGLGFLRSSDRRTQPRQRGLMEVLDWSWSLLSEAQRLLCRRLALFPDGFDLRAAGCMAPQVSRLELLTDIDELVALSVLRIDDDADGFARYRMYETVREFATGLSASDDDVRAARDGAAVWARGLAVSMLEGLSSPNQGEVLHRVKVEAANLRTVLTARLADDDSDTALACGFALGMEALARGDWAELGRLIEVLGDVGTGFGQDADRGLEAGTQPDAAQASEVNTETSASGALADVLLWWRIIAAGRSLFMGRPEQAAATVTALTQARESHRDAGAAACAMTAILLALPGGDVAAEVVAAASSPAPTARRLGLMVAAFFADNSGDVDAAAQYATSAYDQAMADRDLLTATFAAQILTGIHAQGLDGGATIAWANRAARGFATLGVDSEAQVLGRYAACAHLVAGDLDAAHAAFAGYLASQHPAPDAVLFGRAGLAETALARAEACEASPVEALADYRAALLDGAWSSTDAALWPMLFASSCLVAHARHARADDPELAILAERLRAFVVRIHRDHPSTTDGPALGAIAGAFASWLAGTGKDDAGAQRLAELAVGLRARQDLPGLNRAHLMALLLADGNPDTQISTPSAELADEVLVLLDERGFPAAAH